MNKRWSVKRLIVVLIAILLLVVDNSISPFISIFSAAPSVLFVFAIGYSIIYGKTEGVFIGVLTGLLQDIYFFNGFGVNALINMLCCYAVAYVGEGIWKDRKVIPVISVFVASIIKYIAVFIILNLLGEKIGFSRGFFIAIYNSVILFFTYNLGFKLSDKKQKESSWKRTEW